MGPSQKIVAPTQLLSVINRLTLYFFAVNKGSVVLSTLDEETRKKCEKVFNTGVNLLKVHPSRCLLPSEYVFYEQKIRNMPVYEDDVWMISFPRSGSFWLMEMTWLIGNDFDYEKARTVIIKRSPTLEGPILSQRGNFDCWTKEMSDSLEYIISMPRPRYIKTHLPWDLLPKQFHEKKPKIIYVTRNPKDICVSFYHYCRMFHGVIGSFNDFADLMLHDDLPYCPFWGHVLPFWKARSQDNVLFLMYEEAKRDQGAVIKKTAKFLGKTVTDEQVAGLCEHLKFSKIAANPSVNIVLTIMDEKKLNDPNLKFIRKGKVGDWANHMSEDLAQRFNKWMEEHLHGTGLKFDVDIMSEKD